jgi:UDPglucose 6-dehydrogenase
MPLYPPQRRRSKAMKISDDVAVNPRLTVVGTGYLGATHAVCMALLGFDVLGVDVDEQKIRTLKSGRVPFFEPGLDLKLQEALDSGRLNFTTDFTRAAEWGDVHFVCVGTPQLPDSHAADLRYVRNAVAELARHLTRKVLIVGKSTVPIGTAEQLTGLVHSLAPAGRAIELAWNPEFLREGYAVKDTLHPDRLVFGVSSAWAESQLRAVYAPLIDDGTPVVIADLATAELVKVAANSFLATKISYINAMAEVCEAAGADVAVLSTALGYDDRIGSRFLKPGLGFGGGCLPKDIRAFIHRAEELGVGHSVAFLREVDGINLRRRTRTVDLIRELAGGSLEGVKVAALGAAFKPNSDDIRDAPALDVARMLRTEGAMVTIYDPKARENAQRAYRGFTFADDLEGALQDADVVALLTEWQEFRDADPDDWGRLVGHRRVVDGRHALDADEYRRKGWEYRALGRPAQSPSVSLLDDRDDRDALLSA